MIKIGDRELVYSATLIMPDGEHAWIEFEAGNWLVKLKISFAPRADNSENAQIRVASAEDHTHAEITLLGWTEIIGIATTEPAQIGLTLTRQPLLMMASNYRFEIVNRLNLNFLLGEKL